jgi:hypothetical protein
MRYERAYTRRQRAVTFIGTKRTITIPLETADFNRLERLAAKRDIGNAILGRQIIRKYLKRADESSPTPKIKKTPHRDFVHWRFSDAGLRVHRHRHPTPASENLHRMRHFGWSLGSSFAARCASLGL